MFWWDYFKNIQLCTFIQFSSPPTSRLPQCWARSQALKSLASGIFVELKTEATRSHWFFLLLIKLKGTAMTVVNGGDRCLGRPLERKSAFKWRLETEICGSLRSEDLSPALPSALPFPAPPAHTQVARPCRQWSRATAYRCNGSHLERSPESQALGPGSGRTSGREEIMQAWVSTGLWLPGWTDDSDHRGPSVGELCDRTRTLRANGPPKWLRLIPPQSRSVESQN